MVALSQCCWLANPTDVMLSLTHLLTLTHCCTVQGCFGKDHSEVWYQSLGNPFLTYFFSIFIFIQILFISSPPPLNYRTHLTNYKLSPSVSLLLRNIVLINALAFYTALLNLKIKKTFYTTNIKTFFFISWIIVQLLKYKWKFFFVTKSLSFKLR